MEIQTRASLRSNKKIDDDEYVYKDLTNYVIDKINDSDIVKNQKEKQNLLKNTSRSFTTTRL